MNDFSDKIIQILNHGALNLALSLGYSLKIFDVMDEIGKPATRLQGNPIIDKKYKICKILCCFKFIK